MARWGKRVTYEQRRRREAVKRQLRELWLVIGVIVCLLAGTGVVIALLPWGPAPGRSFIAGVLVASAVWMVLALVFVRTYSETMGEWGESFTREVLEARWVKWPVLHDLPLADVNVDHIAITPRAVLAIESKYRGPGARQDGRRHQNDLAETQRRARSARLLIASREVGHAVPVEPVLILWGIGSPRIEGGHRLEDGVTVVQGQHAQEWLRSYAEGPITREQAAAIHAGLAAFQRKRDEYSAARAAVQRR